MRPTAFDYEVTIIGGSLAGAAAAIALGRYGIRTLVVDKSKFPRRKACGEGLSTVALPLLDRLGVLEKCRLLHPTELYGFDIYRGQRKRSTIRARQPVVWGIPRFLLDATLLDHAATFESVSVLQQEKVSKIVTTDQGVRIVTSAGAMHSRYVVIATGANDSLQRTIGITNIEARTVRSAVSYVLMSSTQSDLVSVAVQKGGECYLTPLHDGRMNLALLANGKVSDVWGNERTRWTSIARILDELGIEAVQKSEAVGASGLGRRATAAIRGRAFLVGDALRSFDPIGGMGMTHAIGTGVVAGETIVNLLRGSVNDAEAHRVYRLASKQLAAACAAMTSFSGGFIQTLSGVPGISMLSNYVGGYCHHFMASRAGRRVEEVTKSELLGLR